MDISVDTCLTGCAMPVHPVIILFKGFDVENCSCPKRVLEVQVIYNT